MAAEHQIDRAFQDLGTLFAAEHSEHDDDGARQIHALIRLLRKFKAHEQAEHASILTNPAFREATYGPDGGPKVWYDGGDAIRDAADVYTVVQELHGTGSPNLENTQAEGLIHHLQRGGGLGEMQIGLLRRLMTKHKAAIDKLRRSPDRDGQDILDLPPAGAENRIIPASKGA